MSWSALNEEKEGLRIALRKAWFQIDTYQQSLAMRKLIHGDRPHPDLALSLANLGNTYRKSGNNPKAVELLQSAYEMFLKTVGAEHPDAKRAKASLDAAKEAI